MDKSEMAHQIIDLVEFAIRKTHPEIDKIASDSEGNTLLYGEVYYDLENEIVNDFLETELEISELIKRLEIRKRQLSAQLQERKYRTYLGYKVTSMHHMRDIITTLAVLEGKPNAKALLLNMPQETE